MSSPMMTRMFGFCCCADAGATIVEASDASNAKRMLLLFILDLLAKGLFEKPAWAPCTGRPRSRTAKLFYVAFLFARGVVSGLLDLFQDAAEVVALGRLQRRELLVRHQVFQPQLLADGQHIPVILEGCHGGAECTAHAHRRLLVDAHILGG